MAAGSYEVIQYNRNNGKDCAGLRGIIWTALFLHSINAIFCLINIAKLEMKLCVFNAVCTLGVTELIAIVWLQVGYFTS